MAFLFGGALSMTLEDFDGCVFEGAEIRAYEEMTEPCQVALEPCHARMHLDPDDVPHDIGRRVLLERCLREDGGRFYVLLQRHTIEVLGALPRDVDADTQADVFDALVQAPQDEAEELRDACLEVAPSVGEIATHLCNRVWRYETLLRARQAVKEGAP